MNANLQLLADGYQTITREDTLQALVKMDEKTRATLIDKMVSDKTLQQQADLNNIQLTGTRDYAHGKEQ